MGSPCSRPQLHCSAPRSSSRAARSPSPRPTARPSRRWCRRSAAIRRRNPIGAAARPNAPRSKPSRRIPDAAADAVELGPREADGNPAWVHFRLEVIEVQEEVYPGELVTFWVYAPVGRAAGSPARVPSPTLRVQQGTPSICTLYNAHGRPSCNRKGAAQDRTRQKRALTLQSLFSKYR